MGTAGEVRTNSDGLLRMDAPVLVDMRKLTFIRFVQILGAVERTFQAWWPIGIDGKIGSKEPVLFVYLDGDDDDDGDFWGPIVIKLFQQIIIKDLWVRSLQVLRKFCTTIKVQVGQ